MKQSNSGSWRGSLSPVLLVALVSALVLGLATVLKPYVYFVFTPDVYLPLHSLAEIASVVVSFAVFAVYWNAARTARNVRALLIGTAFLAVAFLDAMHALSFPGMPEFVTPSSVEKGIFYWLPARIWAALALFVSALLPSSARNSLLRRGPLLLLNLAVVAVVFVSVSFFANYIPPLFVPGEGLTPLKIGLEYTVAAICLLAALLYLKEYKATADRFVQLLVMGLVVTVFSELSFTLYAAAYDIYNLLGHIYKIVAYYFIFNALFVSEVQWPYTQLERLYDQIDNELKRTISELKVRNDELETFAYSVSHDLRAPLRHIDGFSEILLEDYGDKLDEQGREYLQYVRGGSQRMAQLIDAMLKLSRVTRKEIRYESIDLAPLVHEIAGELRQQEPERQVEFLIANAGVINGDPGLIRTMLENLLGNAWKFTSKCLVARIEFGVVRQDGETVYFVRDNGAGFDAAYANKLFGPFQRLHRAEEFPGTGIGLATVQRIVRRHGGRIWAEGTLGKGATFYFTLR